MKMVQCIFNTYTQIMALDDTSSYRFFLSLSLFYYYYFFCLILFRCKNLSIYKYLTFKEETKQNMENYYIVLFILRDK